MSSIIEEKGTEFLSRFDNYTFLPIDDTILPRLTSQDIVEIHGGPGSGKTEFLYHCIVRCILPDAPWNDIEFKGLDMRVIFIDNDLRFNLLRLIRILEKRIRSVIAQHNIQIDSDDLTDFIYERLELLDIVKCSDFDTFICSLKFLEIQKRSKFVLMVDGVTSFFWLTNEITSYFPVRVDDPLWTIASVVQSVSKHCSVPVFATRRKLVQSADYDDKLVSTWSKVVTRQIEVESTGSYPGADGIVLRIAGSNLKMFGTITDFGFDLLKVAKK